MNKMCWKPYILLGLLCCMLYLPGISVVPMMDRDSAHFTQATKQMLQTGQYFQIRFQEKTRFQKPPGINWLQAASVKLFSDKSANTVWPYRIPSFLGGLLSVLLLFSFAKKYLGEKTALLAASLLAVSLLLVVESHLAVIDASLLSAVMLMQGALWRIYMQAHQDENKRVPHVGWALLFWSAMAYGLVLKGVTPLVGFLSLVTLSLVDRNCRWLKGLRFGWGIPLLLLSLVWLLLINEAEQSNYLLKMVQKDLLPKLKGGHESHGQPPLFHLASLPLTFWPSSLFLWLAGVRAWQHKHARIEKFLLAWIIPTWIFFELMPTKLPQYVLPTFPAIACLAALAIDNWRALAIRGRHLKWLTFLIGLWLIFSIAIASAFIALSYLVLQKVTLISAALCLVIVLFASVATFVAWQTKYRQAAYAVIIGVAVSYALIYQCFLPSLTPIWLSERIVESLGSERLSELSSSKPLLAIGYEEPSLVFNLNTSKVKFIDQAKAIVAIKGNRAKFVVIDGRQYRVFEALAKQNQLNLCQFSVVKGINYSKGKLVTLRLLEIRDDNEC